MPCYLTGSAWAIDVAAEESSKRMLKKLQKTTRLLCEANELIDKFAPLFTPDPRSKQLRKWWKKHQKIDKKRKKKR